MSSTAKTVCPPAARWSTTLEPMKPAPPVTTMRFGWDLFDGLIVSDRSVRSESLCGPGSADAGGLITSGRAHYGHPAARGSASEAIGVMGPGHGPRAASSVGPI